MLEASADEILEILDQGARDFIFPMLDNGYLYLAATRLNLYRSAADWAIVFDVFGFSPRAGEPNLQVTTFTSNPVRTKALEDFANEEARRNYLQLWANAEQSWFYPIGGTDWIDAEDGERVDPAARSLVLRGTRIALPDAEAFAAADIVMEESMPLVFEMSRALAHLHRDAVLASEEERRTNLLPELRPILTLEDWHHPDVADPEALPSQTETFQQLAAVLVTGDRSLYSTSEPPNTHWSNWPDAGTL